MKELKIKIEQLDNARAQIYQALEFAETVSVSKILFEKRKVSFLRKISAFRKGLDVLLPNLIYRDFVIVVHYEGRSLDRATYIEVQLCLSHDEDEILMAVSTSTVG